MSRALCSVFVLAASSGLLFSAAAEAICTAGAKKLRVPEDCGTIAEAVTALGDGGTIDLAAATYTFGSSGLSLSAKNKAMTLAARATGAVTFSGQGLYPVVKIVNGVSNGKPIVFEGIRFVDGYSNAGFQAGGVTLRRAEATFADCEFVDNRNDEATTGGGALGLYGGSRALVVRTRFETNRARNQGGAIYVYTHATDGPSSLWLHRSELIGNSTAFAGFTPTASGGAIYQFNARVYVTDSLFSENVGAWIGGAILAWGEMGASPPYCDYAAPRGRLFVARSRFERNRADDSAGEATVPQTFGGALHAENCVAVSILDSELEENSADWGGAISLDHAALELANSTLAFNFSSAPTSTEGYAIGGTLAATATDGGINHPHGAVSIARTLVRGGRIEDSNAPNSQIGGCLKAIGDSSLPIPIPSSARLPIAIEDSILIDCAVDLYGSEPYVGGGAADLDRASLALERVIVARSRAVATGAGTAWGATLAVREDSRVVYGPDVAFADGESDGPAGEVQLTADSQATGSFVALDSADNAPPFGLLVAAPARPAPGFATTGSALLGWAWRGAAAALDEEPLTSAPKNGIDAAPDGPHLLAVDGLGACPACATTIDPPVYPWATLAASPNPIAGGGSSTLAFDHLEGSFVAALVDRGVGEVAASGQVVVTPGASATWRRLTVTREGGVLDEIRIFVAETPPAGGLLLRSDFESGYAGWSSFAD